MVNSPAAAPDSPIEFSNAVTHFAGNSVENSSTCNTINDNFWSIDSGATCHLAIHKHLFIPFETLNIHQSIYLPDD